MGEIAAHAEKKAVFIQFMTCFKDTFCSVLQTVCVFCFHVAPIS